MRSRRSCEGLPRLLFPLTLTLITVLILTVALITDTESGERKPVKPSPKDKCPVCGMFVAKHRDFLAEIVFKDGSYAVFDGTKDMLKYYFNIGRYNPSKKRSEIDSIYVTDYYNLTFMDAYHAYYVLGSDIYGPMGKELIPLQKEGDAKEFMKDHKGKSLLRFGDITQQMVKGLD